MERCWMPAKGNHARFFDVSGALPSKGASIEGRDAETKMRYNEIGGKKIKCSSITG